MVPMVRAGERQQARGVRARMAACPRRFTAVGANNVIWIWSPNVIGNLKDVDLAGLYPGSDYIDWLGLGGYYRKPISGKPATFDNTFGESSRRCGRSMTNRSCSARSAARRPAATSQPGYGACSRRSPSSQT
jgi:hypothetical protein